jgi:myosin heavy subunit
VEYIIDAIGFKSQVAFGATKIFIKEPKTLFELEQLREKRIPQILAKVQVHYQPKFKQGSTFVPQRASSVLFIAAS